jgi:hypothetical protein
MRLLRAGQRSVRRLNCGVMRRLTVAVTCLLMTQLSLAQETLPPQCPKRGTLEVVANPAAWANQCFAAVNGRTPRSGSIAETESVTRDVDLDGIGERLEIRGTGNAMKQIYVFGSTAQGLIYLGELDAHPSFTVEADAEGVATISYLHRFGSDRIELKRIQYRDNEYVEISSEKVR